MVSSATNHKVAGTGKFRRKSLVPKRLSIGSKGVVSGELGLLLISGGVWVYRGIVAVNGGRTP